MTVSTVNGQVEVAFHASDRAGLAAAWLIRNGNLVAELPLSGTNVTAKLDTPDYEPGVENTFEVFVYDTQGNRQRYETKVTPNEGSDRAPLPFLYTQQTIVEAGRPVLFDASRSTDPDGTTAQLTYAWDLNGDGVFETQGPQATQTVTVDAAGTRLIRVKVTDSQGASSISEPLPMRIIQAPPRLQFATGTIRVNEAHPLTLTVTRTGDTEPVVTVHYATADGTAQAGTDYLATSGDLAFNAGETSKTFTITTLDDYNALGDKSFSVVLSAPQLGRDPRNTEHGERNDPRQPPRTVPVQHGWGSRQRGEVHDSDCDTNRRQRRGGDGPLRHG